MPVDRSSDPFSVTSLQAVDRAENLGGVAAHGGGVEHGQSNFLIRINDEHGADGEGDALLIDIGQVLCVDHIIQPRHFPIGISDDGKLQVGAGDVVDIFDPLLVRRQIIGAESNHFDIPTDKFIFEFGKRSEFGGADGSEVGWVGEEDAPAVVEEFVKVDLALGGLSTEVWRG